MLWYGSNPQKVFNKTTLLKRRLNRKTKLLNNDLNKVNRLAYKRHYLYIPPLWDVLVYKTGIGDK